MVSKPEYRDGRRYQDVEIYYNGVGIIRESSPEEMEEYLKYQALGHLPYGGCPKGNLLSVPCFPGCQRICRCIQQIPCSQLILPLRLWTNIPRYVYRF